MGEQANAQAMTKQELEKTTKMDSGKKPTKDDLDRLTVKVKEAAKLVTRMSDQVHKVIVGNEYVVDDVMRCILSNGHILMEGAPGAAKTLLINSFAQSVKGSEFKRIQFTPDLLPADVIGIQAYDPVKGFYIVKGPVFCNFLLADEINRAPPKVQSAMLEVMQERQTTIGKETFILPKPFLVMATQNPVEQGGTFPLPEAQVDRFLFKVMVDYPNRDSEIYIVENNSMVRAMEDFKIEQVTSPEQIVDLQSLTKKVYTAPAIRQYIVDIIMTTRAGGGPLHDSLKYSKYLAWGSSPRASIALFVASKANALMQGRAYVLPEDVQSVAHSILRHRLLLNYEGKASGIATDSIVDEILRIVPIP